MALKLPVSFFTCTGRLKAETFLRTPVRQCHPQCFIHGDSEGAISLTKPARRTPMAYSFSGLGSTQQSYCCTCQLVQQQLQARQHTQLPRLNAYCHVGSKCPPALLVSGRAFTQSTATQKPVTAQPVGHGDKEVHSSPQGAMNGKQGSLSDKNQKRKQAGCLIGSQDEVSDKCSQSLRAAKPNGASATTRRQRTRFVNSALFRHFISVVA